MLMKEYEQIGKLAKEFRGTDIKRIHDLYHRALFGVFNLDEMKILAHEKIVNNHYFIAYKIVKDELKRRGYVGSYSKNKKLTTFKYN